MMRRDDCLKALARHRTNEIVVPVYKAAQEWLVFSPHDLNYTFTGAMGQGPPHALGLALGRPDKRIVVLDGDGSLLMNLGCLVTIAQAAPRNFVHCVCQNGGYESNGGVPLPGIGRLSFAAMARAAGWTKVHEFHELSAWEAAIPGLLRDEGPIFAVLHMEPGDDYPEDFQRLSSVPHRDAFIRALAADGG
jgi:phosphonopyruvate decarboxylase